MIFCKVGGGGGGKGKAQRWNGIKKSKASSCFCFMLPWRSFHAAHEEQKREKTERDWVRVERLKKQQDRRREGSLKGPEENGQQKSVWASDDALGQLVETFFERELERKRESKMAAL